MGSVNVDFDRTKAFPAAWDCFSSPLGVSIQLGSGADFVVWLSTRLFGKSVTSLGFCCLYDQA